MPSPTGSAIAPQPPGCPRSARARTAGQIARGDGFAATMGEASRVRANGGSGASYLAPRACTDADCPPRAGAIGPTARPKWGCLIGDRSVWREAPGGIWTAPLDARLSHVGAIFSRACCPESVGASAMTPGPSRRPLGYGESHLARRRNRLDGTSRCRCPLLQPSTLGRREGERVGVWSGPDETRVRVADGSVTTLGPREFRRA